MKTYEELSDNAKQGLENFRKDIPRLLKELKIEFIPRYLSFVPIKSQESAVRYYIHSHNVVFVYCLAAGACMQESYDASNFAYSKNYWLPNK